MRLSSNEINTLKHKLYELSTEAKLYLFGSRVDDTKNGGDIDLLLVSDKLTKKDIRNTVVHEYIEDALTETFDEVLIYTKILIQIINTTLKYMKNIQK